MQFCFRAAVVLTVVSFALSALVGQPPGPGGSGQPRSAGTTPTPAKTQLSVKVFQLERGEPEAVITSLHALLDNPVAEVTQPAHAGGTPPGGLTGGFAGLITPGGLQGGLGFGSKPTPAAGQFGCGGIGCFLGTGTAGTPPAWWATNYSRTRSVVVRGSSRHLLVAADLVAIYDRPANAPLPKLQVVTAFVLKHATAEEVAEVLQALSFDDVKLTTIDERVVAVIAGDELGTVTDLIKGLDVPAKDGGKPVSGK